MDNELIKNSDVKVNIDIGGPATFGIAAVTVAGLCFCFYTGIRNRYTVRIGALTLSPNQSTTLLPA